MTKIDPEVILRLGSHAEKEYLEKTIKFFDGIMVAANLLEATPGATSSLLIRVAGAKPPTIPYYIDPMTYGFAEDTDYLKSERKKKGQPAVWDFKRSYKQLAEQYGGVFGEVIEQDQAIELDDFPDSESIFDVCESVAKYQINRVSSELALDEEFAKASEHVPKPAAILTPYFYLGSGDWEPWFDLIPRFARGTVSLGYDIPVHSVVCADESHLYDSGFIERLLEDIPLTGVSGVWLWFSRLNEHNADMEQLEALRHIVEELSNSVEVFNMHGGFYSLALCQYGMKGISHGIGYGEQKDVVPVQGQSTPTVRYYLPAVYKRLGVPDIERAFGKLGIKTVKDFYKSICDCVVCRGVVSKSLDEFSAFGDLHYSSFDSKRQSQTPAAAKRCRFHFLLCRIKERNAMRSLSLDSLIKQLEKSSKQWMKQPSIAKDARHLKRWVDALQSESAS